MLELRPIVVDSDMVVLGGNMRLKACQAAGLKEVPILIADQLTDEQKDEFIIKDNVGFGEWDWDLLANEWDIDSLNDWGLELPTFETDLNEKMPMSIEIEFENAEELDKAESEIHEFVRKFNITNFKIK
jgi:ParB-like chromosome segregation protein Spo0J